MANQEVLSFIKHQTAKGFSKEEITKVLITQGGWTEEDVNLAYATLGDSVMGSVEAEQPVQTVSPVPSPQQASENLNKKSGKSFGFKLLFFIVIGLVLAGGGALAYVGWNHFKPFSETASVFDAYAKMFELESVSYDFKQSITSPDSEDFLNLNLVGSVSGTSVDNLKVDNVYGLRFNYSDEFFGAFNLETEIGMRFIDKAIYLSILKLPDLSQMDMMQFFDLSLFENLWVKFDLYETLEGAGEFGLEVSPEEDLEKLKDLLSVLISKKEEIKKINDKHNFWTVEKMPDQLLAGVDTNSYKTTVDFVSLIEAMPEIFEVLKDENAFLEEFVLLVKDAEEGFFKDAEELKRVASEIGNFTIETSVGKEDGYIHKIKNITEISVDEIANGGVDYDTVIIETEILFSKHNQPVEVVVPSEYKTIEELEKLMEELFTPAMIIMMGAEGTEVGGFEDGGEFDGPTNN